MDLNEPELLNRMREDEWYFAVLLSTGDVIGVEKILSETETHYDFSLLDKSAHDKFTAFGKKVTVASTARKTCSVRIESVIAIQELSDS